MVWDWSLSPPGPGFGACRFGFEGQIQDNGAYTGRVGYTHSTPVRHAGKHEPRAMPLAIPSAGSDAARSRVRAPP